ncbi:MAG: GNAT family N-acetyltransferase [Chitinophagaceae bacterium]|jgi:ribosomal protein S18 acetylase RimI-like enzyme|nr:GNAT family N-acetyltransferase [Chitinophagaceae bacterium]
MSLPNNTKNIRVAEASSPEDYDTAAQLFTAYQQELGVDLCFQGFREELENLPAMYGPPHGRLLLAREGAETLGCVALRPKGDSTCEMKRLYVKPESRGTGAGRLLASSIVDAARQLGYERMVLDTLNTLQPAIRLYESLGFTICEPYYHNPLPGVVFMQLELP